MREIFRWLNIFMTSRTSYLSLYISDEREKFLYSQHVLILRVMDVVNIFDQFIPSFISFLFLFPLEVTYSCTRASAVVVLNCWFEFIIFFDSGQFEIANFSLPEIKISHVCTYLYKIHRSTMYFYCTYKSNFVLINSIL